MTWIRLYVDALNNPKLLSLDHFSFRIYVNSLLMASKGAGKVVLTDGLCRSLRARKDHLTTALTRIVEAGLMEVEGNVYTVHNWNKRQYLDTTSERVKSHRERKKTTGDVTLHDRYRNANMKRYSNGLRTDTDTDAVVQVPKQASALAQATAAAASIDWSEPDATEAIRRLMDQLASRWPNPGNVPMARMAAEQEWSRSQTPIGEWCAKVEASNAKWLDYHQAKLAVKAGHYVPYLSKWLQDGDYARKAPVAPKPEPVDKPNYIKRGDW